MFKLSGAILRSDNFKENFKRKSWAVACPLIEIFQIAVPHHHHNGCEMIWFFINIMKFYYFYNLLRYPDSKSRDKNGSKTGQSHLKIPVQKINFILACFWWRVIIERNERLFWKWNGLRLSLQFLETKHIHQSIIILSKTWQTINKQS